MLEIEIVLWGQRDTWYLGLAELEGLVGFLEGLAGLYHPALE